MRTFCFLMGVAVGMLWPAFNFDGSTPGDHAVPGVWPDPRVVWEEYPVGGYGLVGRDTTITLPKGAWLEVPRNVKPDSTRRKHLTSRDA